MFAAVSVIFISAMSCLMPTVQPSFVIPFEATTSLQIKPISFADCWNQTPHFRPTFAGIIKSLEEVQLSSFMNTPHDSFHTLQEDWRLEIEEMFDELRSREKVGENNLKFW